MASYDSAYLSYLRRLGAESQTARRHGRMRRRDLEAQFRGSERGIREEGIQQRRQIDEGAETRGIFRSGERLRGLARQRAREERQVGELARGLVSNVGSVNIGTQETLDRIARERAERELEAAARAEQQRQDRAYYRDIYGI